MFSNSSIAFGCSTREKITSQMCSAVFRYLPICSLICSDFEMFTLRAPVSDATDFFQGAARGISIHQLHTHQSRNLQKTGVKRFRFWRNSCFWLVSTAMAMGTKIYEKRKQMNVFGVNLISNL